MEKIIRTDCMRNGEVLLRVKKEKNMVETIKRRKANSNCHIRSRNGLLKYIIEGMIEGRIEMTERRGRRRDQLLDDRQKKERILLIESGSTRLPSMQNSLCNSLGICQETDSSVLNVRK